MITKVEVIAALNKALDQYGDDWVDPNAIKKGSVCKNLYKINGEVKRCIAAQALHNLGISDELLNSYNGSSVNHLVTYERIKIDQDALKILDNAQYLQDKGIAWKQCVDEALLFALQ